MVKLVVTDKDGRDVELDARPGLSVMENIRQLPRSVEAICGGLCSCATCHVFIEAAWMRRLPPRRYEERLMLASSAAFDSTRSRLSCQIKVTAELEGRRAQRTLIRRAAKRCGVTNAALRRGASRAPAWCQRLARRRCVLA